MSENGNSEFEYDLVTIGAGSGGVRASRMAAGTYGAKVAIVELPYGLVSSDSVGGAGGTCVLRGCVPKKLLVYASEFSDCFQDAQGFGWGSTTPPHNHRQLLKKKADEVKRLNGVYMNILKSAGVEFVEGRGVVLDPHTVEVRGGDGSVRRLRAKNILVATGGHAVKIPVPGADLAFTSDEALVLEELHSGPIVVVGGGYIAVEFAGIFRGLGAEVHLFYRAPAPLRGFDEECRKVIAENLQRRGVKIYPECTPVGIEREAESSLTLRYKAKSGEEGALGCSQVMFATGRKANTKGLGLEDAGVRLEEKSGAVVVDDMSRTSVPSIWAIGDVTDRMALTPVAIMEGKALAATLFGGRPTKPDYKNVPSAVFCQPPLASVGVTEEEAVATMRGEIDVYVSRFRPMKNTLSGREERTFMKMLVHVPTDKVVGCHMVGPDAAEIMQGLSIAVKAGATKAAFDSTVGIHPSAAEEWVTMSSPARRVQGRGGEGNGDKE